ncbi:type VI secretion system protein TssL, short form [Pseudomonas sp. BJa5]|uniref:type VI secretion system protein TssL, short form n=1 Tax=Pseudomonas sp. BJa5 TaxID=2936270 RepID=UPI00255956EB|nr:type VI secretion system protein TssL, short form [Pseudomonas sp. BGr12]MDL2421705.1 type VI secretion system protein TssL, short form [Pseudomonas sp. BGr12]
MNPITTGTPSTVAVDVDALLQDSYLLVVELRHGASAQNSLELQQRSARQVERVREQLAAAGVSQRSIDHISHAQCALLDEVMLGCAKGVAHDGWASEPLQAKFFSHHQAGESLYEDMREVLREPAPDLQVLTAFQRVLALGFQGRYRDINDPERAQLLTALNAQVAPLSTGPVPVALAGPGLPTGNLRGLRSPWAHALAAALLLAGGWWGLDAMLGKLIFAYLLGQV